MAAWVELKSARRLRALGPVPGAADLPDDNSSSPYRSFTVQHSHRVCPVCYAHLASGGEFHALTRHRGRLTVLVLIAVVALLLAAAPYLFPHLLSAFWLMDGEGGR
jgi:hypothetical protein